MTLIPGAHRVSPGSLPIVESRPLLLLDIDGTVMAVWQQSFPFDYSAVCQTFAMSIRVEISKYCSDPTWFTPSMPLHPNWK